MTNYMRPYWERRLADLDTAKQYAERQVDALVLKAIGQLGIPIEALLDEIGNQEAADARWGITGEVEAL